MKRFVPLLGALAALLVPPTLTAAVPAQTVAAPVYTDGDESRIPSELCLGVLGQDFEKNVCSDGSGGVTGGGT